MLGVVNVDIHYYEDGNVRLSAVRSVEIGFTPSASGSDVMKGLAAAEQKLHEGLNQEFSSLSEGVFKGLRRQLPVTRQKVEWDKIGSYRVGLNSQRTWWVADIVCSWDKISVEEELDSRRC